MSSAVGSPTGSQRMHRWTSEALANSRPWRWPSHRSAKPTTSPTIDPESGGPCRHGVAVTSIGGRPDVIRRAAGNLRSSPLYRLVTDHVAYLAADADRVSTDPGAAALGAASIELARALLVSAGHSDRHSRAVLAETLLTRVRAYVRQHLTDPELRPATIAAADNVSLRHLYKACAQAGFSLEQWITANAHFTRRFRAMYGLTPRELRHVAGAQVGPSETVARITT
jgi:AraC-like DNA-binding protein